MKTSIPFVSYIGFEQEITEELLAAKIEEYLACGQRLFTLTSNMMTELIDHEEHVKPFKDVFAKYGVSCLCAHGEWNEGKEISLPFDGDRKCMLERVKRSIELTAEFGGKVIALHAENWSNDNFRPRTLEQWQSYINDGLEKMLPVAEKNNVILCLENIWSQLSMPDVLNGFIRRFPSTFLGLCYDAGHANVLKATGTRACSWMPWACNDFGCVPWNDNILDQMLPNIVMTHLHDNATDTDSHDLPGHGNIDWNTVVSKLADAPRLIANQDEVSTQFHYSARTVLDAFAKIGFTIPQN